MGRPPKNKPTPTPEKKVKAAKVKPEAETKPTIEETKLEEPEIKTELLESEAEKPEILETQPESKPVDKIFEKYQEKCAEESDINELLPYIYEIAQQCDHCTELGVRRPTSTYAFLAAKPKRVVSYDIGRYDEEVSEVERLCKEAGQDFEFILGSSAHVEIEETDCCLVDTLHTKKMLETELALHADKVRKFILLHDTFGPYWETGEAPYNDETSPYGGGLGLKYAIEPFLENHPEWTVFAKHDFNNGLMILKRIQ